MTVDAGIILEYRIKKLLFYQGYLSRNHLTLRSYFYPDTVDVTDIDAVGFRFTSNFDPEILICECKSGDSDGTVDRILWLVGLSEYFSASSSIIVRKAIPAKIKHFAQDVGIIPIDYARLKEIEKNNGVPSGFLGSCDYEYYEPRIQKYYLDLKDNPHLSKIYWFLRSRYWYSENSARLKQTITALKMMAANAKPEPIRWLTYEASILFSLSLVNLCRDLFPLTETERPEFVNNLLITGVGSPEYSKKVLGAAYGLLASVDREKKGKATKVSYDDLKIPPPEYATSLIELVERMIQKPSVSVEVPRFLDFIFFEFLFKDKTIDEKVVKELFPANTSLVAKMGKNITKFIVDNTGISENLYKNLVDF
jgi:hypothetical protein